jgi:hypothetical protein
LATWRRCPVMQQCSSTLLRLLSDATIMNDLSATPHNNAVQHYYVRDNGHGGRRLLWLRDGCVRASVDLWS